MAILGVTDRGSLEPRFKVIGKLRKGGPKQSNRPGQDLEYFRFTSDNADVTKAFFAAYDAKPAELEVYFPYATYEAVFPTARELYGQNGLLKEQCDGEYIVQWQEGPRMRRGKRLCEKKCKDTSSTPPCPDCPLKPIGRLSVVLVPLLQAGIVGTVTLETHGWNDVSHIAGQLAMYEPLTGRAFRVYRQKMRVGAPNKKTGKRMAVDKWMVRIEPTQETALMLIGDAQRRARMELTGVTDVPQLEAGPKVVWYENNQGNLEPWTRGKDGHLVRCDEGGKVITPDMIQEPGQVVVNPDVVDPGGYDGFVTEDDIPFDVEPEPEAVTHWIDETRVDGATGEVIVIKDRFWAWTESIGMHASDVYNALEAEDIHDYAGDMKAAREAIEAYAEAHPLPAEVTE